MRRKRAARITLFLLAFLSGVIGLWLRAEWRQIVLNRQLIFALVHGDTRRALVLVNEGAAPNTPYSSLPPPSLLQLLTRPFYRPSVPISHDPTAFSIAC